MENTAQAVKLYIIFSTVKGTYSVQEKQTINTQVHMDQQGTIWYLKTDISNIQSTIFTK